MSDADEAAQGPTSALDALTAIYEHFWSVFLRGIAIIVPVIVTVFLVSIALTYIGRALGPFVDMLEYFGLIGEFRRTELIRFLIRLNVYEYVVNFLSELIALAILLGVILLVGSVGHNRYGERLIEVIDMALASIPGVGTVYKSFRRMGDVMLTTEDENFQDVKLVQCLDEDMYVIGFQTSAAPDPVEEATGHDDMMTLFVPMAPNPVTGGFLTYVPTDRVYEVDMTIEDGVKSILTSGVATGNGAQRSDQLTLDNVRNVAQVDRIQDAIAGQQTKAVSTEEAEATSDDSMADGEGDDEANASSSTDEAANNDGPSRRSGETDAADGGPADAIEDSPDDATDTDSDDVDEIR